jgi:hypothetical protein
MSRRKDYESGFCEVGNHGHCPHLMRSARTVVVNARVTELRELICPCTCHKEAK